MKKYIIVLVILSGIICQHSIFAQIKETNVIDSNGLKQGIWITQPKEYYDFLEDKVKKNDTISYHIFNYYKSQIPIHVDTIRAPITVEVNYVNDTLHGEFCLKLNDSIILTKGYYKDDMLDSILIVYSNFGSMVKESNDIVFLPSSQQVYSISNGKKNGIYKKIGLNGTIERIGTYHNNLSQGAFITFHGCEDFKILNIDFAEKGRLKDGKHFYFHTNGTLKLVQSIKNSKLHGIMEYYSNMGVLIRKERWKKGKYKEVIYPKNERHKASLYYKSW